MITTEPFDTLDELTVDLIRRIVMAVQAGVDGDAHLQEKIIRETELRFAALWPSRAQSLTRH